MNTQVKKIALSVISVLVIVTVVVGSTFAWFTDKEQSGASFHAGVLNISLTGDTDEASGLLEFDNLRPLTLEQFQAELTAEVEAATGVQNKNVDGFNPEPVYFRAVKIANEGTLPAKLLLSLKAAEANDTVKEIVIDGGKITQTGNILPCENKLGEVLKIFVYEYVDGNWTMVEGVNLNTLTKGSDADSYAPADALAAGAERTYILAGYLPEDVGNAYQAQHFHAGIYVGAGQTDPDAPTGGGDVNPPVSEEIQIPVGFTYDGAEVGTSTLSVKEDAFPVDVTTAMVTAPDGYQFAPAEQTQQSTLSAEKVASKVVFTVEPINAPGDPDQDYTYTLAVKYQYGTNVIKTVDKTITVKGDVLTYDVYPEWLTDAENKKANTYSSNNYKYKLAENEDAYKTVTLNPSKNTVVPNEVTFNIVTGLYTSGFGTASDPFIVSNAQEFDNIRYSISSNFKLAKDISLAAGNNRGYFDTIGLGDSSDTPFAGVLDGDNHTVRDIKIDYGTGYSNVGLFAINDGVIKNLTVKTNMSSGDDGVLGGNTVGILAGTNNGTISNVHANGAASGISNADGVESETGVLVGVNAPTGVIEKSSATGSATGYSYVGGLVGKNWGTIRESYSTADVNDQVTDYTVQNSSKRFVYIGGFVGGNAGTIENCYAVPASKVKGYTNIGGFAGGNFSGGSIKNSYCDASGKISYTVSASLSVGYTNGGTVSNLYYVGSSSGYAGTRISAASLQSATSLTGFDSSVWSFPAGQYPDLVNNPR